MSWRSPVARTWELVRPYRWRLVWTLVLLLMVTGLGLLPPVFVATIVGHALTKDVLDTQLFLICVAMFLAAHVSRALLSLLQRYQMRVLGGRLVLDLRRKMYRHLHQLSLSFYESRGAGEIMSRLMNDVQKLAQLVTGTAMDAVVSTFTAVAILGVLLWINWQVALIAIAVLPLHFIGSVFFKGRLAHESWRASEKTAQIYGKANEVFDAAKVVKAHSAERRETHLMLSQLREDFDVGVRAGFLTNAWRSTTTIISQSGTAMVMLVCGLAVLNDRGMTVQSYVLTIAYVGMLYAPISQMIAVANQVIPARVGLQRVFEVLDLQPELESPTDGIRRRLSGHVRFDNVCFAYPEDKQVLHDVSFTAEPGEMIALVGPSGSGKTTIANLLTRFYDRTGGTIELDGEDIQRYALADLREQMSVVLQETHLFRGTIEENLRYGKPDATFAEIQRAAELANAHDFIMAMADQYDTIIGRRGAKLSGGQKQRVAIARALLRNPTLLILDEATSSLDSASEIKVQEALDALMRDRTTVVIAHRLSTIRNADRILVLHEGRIVQRGTHEELIESDGLYRELYDPQAAKQRSHEQEQAIEQLAATN